MTALLLALLTAATPPAADAGSDDGQAQIYEEPNPPQAGADQGTPDQGEPAAQDAQAPTSAELPPPQPHGKGPTSAVLPPMKPGGLEPKPKDATQATDDEEGNAEFRAALATGAVTLPSGTPGGEQDFFAWASPAIVFQGSDEFILSAGADLRFRVIDLDPKQTATDYGANLRREDWDQLSDYGQILRELRIGNADTPFELKAGEIDDYTLGLGHLVNRYANRTDENYHPSGATLRVDTDAVRVEGLVSDLLAARLFAGDVRLDLGRIFGDEGDGGRWHLSVSALQDFAGGDTTKQVTAMEIDPDVVVFDQQGQKVDLYAGLGTRLGEENNPPLGALFGLRTDGRIHHTGFHGSFEVRKQNGRFRQGLIGPTYELARYADVGSSGPSIAAAQLPDGWSFYAGGQLDVPDEDGNIWLVGSASAEHFTFGRTDLGGQLKFRIPGEDKASGAFRLDAVGLGVSPRVFLQAEVRMRFTQAVFGQAFTGTSYFPQPDNSLVHGFYGGFGVGVDFDSSRDTVTPST